MLEAGESKEVVFDIDERAYTVFDEKVNDYRIIGGDYRISAAASSRDIRTSVTVSVDDDDRFIPQITPNMPFEEMFLDTRFPKKIIEELVMALYPETKSDNDDGLDFEDLRRINATVPRQKIVFVATKDDPYGLDRLIDETNAKIREYYQKKN